MGGHTLARLVSSRARLPPSTALLSLSIAQKAQPRTFLISSCCGENSCFIFFLHFNIPPLLHTAVNPPPRRRPRTFHGATHPFVCRAFILIHVPVLASLFGVQPFLYLFPITNPAGIQVSLGGLGALRSVCATWRADPRGRAERLWLWLCLVKIFQRKKKEGKKRTFFLSAPK